MREYRQAVLENVLLNKYTTMKEFLKIMEKDYLKENFSVKEIIVGGIVVPLVMVAIMGLAGWLESCFV